MLVVFRRLRRLRLMPAPGLIAITRMEHQQVPRIKLVHQQQLFRNPASLTVAVAHPGSYVQTASATQRFSPTRIVHVHHRAGGLAVPTTMQAKHVTR
ncbi:MAG: hypothetical protein ACREBG_24400 [Pyrinomonadaceae bacterium]